MTEIRELYQEMILDHNRNPRNFREIANADRKQEGYNPLCGDILTIFMKLNGQHVEDVSFLGSGCAISKASASMMTDAVKGKTEAEAIALFENFHKMLSGDSNYDLDQLGKLAVFQGVNEFPARVKCATLAWHTLESGLERKEEVVSTE